MTVKKYGIKAVTTAALLAMAMLVATSCSGPVSATNQPAPGGPSAPAGMGYFRLNIESLARTVLPTIPSLTGLWLTVDFVPTPDGTAHYREIAPGPLAIPAFPVPVGVYTVTVRAYSDADRNNQVATGTAPAPVPVTADGPNTATVAMFLVAADPLLYGTFTWTITPPTGGAEIEMTLYALNGQTVPPALIGTDVLTNTVGVAIPVGYYRMVITATRAGDYEDRVVQEVVQIRNNLTTNALVTIPAINPIVEHQVTFRNIDGTGLSTATETLPFAHNVLLTSNPDFIASPPPASGLGPDAVFAGWWTTYDGVDQWDLAIHVVRSSITLYARWIGIVTTGNLAVTLTPIEFDNISPDVGGTIIFYTGNFSDIAAGAWTRAVTVANYSDFASVAWFDYDGEELDTGETLTLDFATTNYGALHYDATTVTRYLFVQGTTAAGGHWSSRIAVVATSVNPDP